LFADGQLQSIQLGGKNAAPISVPIPVQVQQTIATPLAINDQGFSPRMDVPTVAQNTSTFLITPDASWLAVGQSNGMPHLYVVDPKNDRPKECGSSI
jgi:N-glycosylase/DNA lyase